MELRQRRHRPRKTVDIVEISNERIVHPDIVDRTAMAKERPEVP